MPSDRTLRVDQVRALIRELARVVSRYGRASLPAGQEALGRQALVHRVDLGAFALDWHRLTIAQREDTAPALWLTWEGPVGDGAAYLGPAHAWILRPLVEALLVRLDGSELEIDAHQVAASAVVRAGTWEHPDGWWPDFKSRPLADGREGQTVGALYEAVLYPAVRAALYGLPAGARVLDVGAGDGRLASLLLDDHPKASVILIERNATQCARASAALSGRRAEVLCADLATAPPQVATGVDAVVGVGALEAGVVSPEAARRWLAWAAPALRPGGLLVLTGSGASLVTASALVAAGLRAENATLPADAPDAPPRTFLVARKPR